MMSVSASGNWHGTVSSATLTDINYSSPRELGWTDVFKKKTDKICKLNTVKYICIIKYSTWVSQKEKKSRRPRSGK